jgi:hypothetical protein
MNNINEFIDRYVAVWNEPDADRRRRSIAELWAEDGASLTQSIEARGYEALEARIASAHEQFVRTGGFIFKSMNKTESHHNVVKFNWIMVPVAGGEVAAAGVNFFILDDDGRIRCDYQFTEPLPLR